MALKTNYGFQKAERDREKQAKKAAKARDKAAAAAANSASSAPLTGEAATEPKPPAATD